MLLRHIPALLTAAVLAACSASPSGPPDPVAPVITVSGVAAGGTYDAPVAIAVSVDRGAYTATLNGAPFSGGGTVSQPGAYELVVSARDGTATSEARIAFTVRFTGARVLIVRLFDLGDNESGGGGDAILLTDSTAIGMRHALIDAGPQGVNASNPGYVAQRLQGLGVARLDFVQLTHAHADHHAWPAWMWRGWTAGRRPLTLVAPPAVVADARSRLETSDSRSMQQRGRVAEGLLALNSHDYELAFDILAVASMYAEDSYMADRKKARKWYGEAAEMGNEEAKKWLENNL